MRRLGLLLALLLCLAPVTAARADEAWRSQQPPGAGGGFPLLGDVGDVECWNGEANRCLLITPGNAGVPGGIFAYDGSSWYRYATVCGGHEGRIAWAGPDEFWTISDQQSGQATEKAPPPAISLCHFKDGQIVASYGQPVNVATSYQQMYAAACAGPDDCWFAGKRLPGTLNQGAFHLHWDGGSLTPVPSLTTFAELSDPGRTVTGLIHSGGGFYESVKVAEGDMPNFEEEDEAALGPSFVHRLEPGAATPFRPLFGTSPVVLGNAFASAEELQGFRLDGGPGEAPWAVAGSEGELARGTVLRLGSEGPEQLPLEDGEGLLGPEALVEGIAAEPGAEDVWVAYRVRSEQAESLVPAARLTRIHADGTLDPELRLPLEADRIGGEPVGNKGVGGPIACPQPGQCWLATRKGWLFHLGADPAPQADPAMHVLIASRPPDESLPTLPPLELPEDNSGSESGASAQEELPSQLEELPKRKPPLLSQIKQRLLHGSVLELSFSLRAKAHVQLIAKRHGAVVARSRRLTLPKGRHSLRVRLDPKRWPTKIDLRATEAKQRGSK